MCHRALPKMSIPNVATYTGWINLFHQTGICCALFTHYKRHSLFTFYIEKKSEKPWLYKYFSCSTITCGLKSLHIYFPSCRCVYDVYTGIAFMRMRTTSYLKAAIIVSISILPGRQRSLCRHNNESKDGKQFIKIKVEVKSFPIHHDYIFYTV